MINLENFPTTGHLILLGALGYLALVVYEKFHSEHSGERSREPKKNNSPAKARTQEKTSQFLSDRVLATVLLALPVLFFVGLSIHIDPNPNYSTNSMQKDPRFDEEILKRAEELRLEEESQYGEQQRVEARRKKEELIEKKENQEAEEPDRDLYYKINDNPELFEGLTNVEKKRFLYMKSHSLVFAEPNNRSDIHFIRDEFKKWRERAGKHVGYFNEKIEMWKRVETMKSEHSLRGPHGR